MMDALLLPALCPSIAHTFTAGLPKACRITTNPVTIQQFEETLLNDQTRTAGELWPHLDAHQEVALRDAKGNRIEGTIDGMTDDRSTLWIQLKGGLGRQLIHHLDGYWLETPAA